MDTPKSEFFKRMLGLILFGTMILSFEKLSLADTRTAADLLIASYKLSAETSPAEVESAITGLEKALSDCNDGYLSFRIKYKIAVLCFNTDITTSKNRFLQIADDPCCPRLIRLCSLNMAGQASRLTREYNDALNAFDKVANSLEQQLTAGKNALEPAFAKLLCLALLGRAEIYEMQNPAAGINEYSRLLRILNLNKSGDALKQYIPLAIDRMSQLYLWLGKFDEYIKSAEQLASNYPRYYRTPIIKFEIECIRLLKTIPGNFDSIDGSFAAPARIIAYIKDSPYKSLARQIAGKLDALCRDCPDIYGKIVLQYHYAWLLDALGERDKAAEIFAEIFSLDPAGNNNEFWKRAIIETIQEYAKIQTAVLLGEKTDFAGASQVLTKLRPQPDKSHISELTKSLANSIDILRKEVSNYEKK